MKQDLSLSLLSRGHFVSSSGNGGGQDGGLDVCFTPQVIHLQEDEKELE